MVRRIIFIYFTVLISVILVQSFEAWCRVSYPPIVPEGEIITDIMEVVQNINNMFNVTSIAFSPDCKILASGSSSLYSDTHSKTIHLWDIYTEKEISRLGRGGISFISSITFSPDGRMIAASDEKKVFIWDVFTGKVLRSINLSLLVTSVAFSVDCKMLALGCQKFYSWSSEKTIYLYDVSDGEEITSLNEQDAEVQSLVFSPDGKFFVSGASNGALRLWDTLTRKQVLEIQNHSRQINSLSFNPDSNIIASASTNKMIYLWDVKTGKKIKQLEGHTASVLSVAFSTDGKMIASGSSDKTVRLWEVSTGKEIARMEGHSSNVLSVIFSPDNRMIASASGSGKRNFYSSIYDYTIRLWDISTGKEISNLEGSSSQVSLLASAQNSNKLVSIPGNTFPISTDNTIRSWDITNGKEKTYITGNTSSIQSLAISDDGKTIATGSSDNFIQLWDLYTGKKIGHLEGHKGSINSLDFSPDAKKLISGSQDGTAILWDLFLSEILIEVINGESVKNNIGKTINNKVSVESVSFNSDGTKFAIGLSDNKIRLWDISTEKNIKTFRCPFIVSRVAFSIDNKILYSGGDNIVIVWDISSEKKLQYIKLNSNSNSIAFSPDGKMIASGSQDKIVRLWNVSTGKEIACLKGHDSFVTSVTFLADGKILASASIDKSIRLWDISTMKLKRIFVAGKRGSWLSCTPNGYCLRSDDGTFLTKVENTKVSSVYPPKPKYPGILSVEGPISLETSDGQSTEFTLTVNNSGTGRIFWVEVIHENPKHLIFFKPPTTHLLESDSFIHLPCQISPAFTYQNPKDMNTTLHLKINAFNAAPFFLNVPVHIRMPEIAIKSAKLLVQDKKTLFVSLFSQTQALNSKVTVKASIGGNELGIQLLNTISLGATNLSFVVPDQIKTDKNISLSLNVNKHTFPIHQWTISNHPIDFPVFPMTRWILLSIIGLALLLIVLFYVSLFFHPVKKRISESPDMLLEEKIDDLPYVIHLLRSTYILRDTLNRNGISKYTLNQARLFPKKSVKEQLKILCDRLHIKIDQHVDKIMNVYKVRMPEELVLNIDECFFVFPDTCHSGAEIYSYFASKEQLHIIISIHKYQQTSLERFRNNYQSLIVFINAKEITQLLLNPSPLDRLESIISGQMKVTLISPYQTSAGVVKETGFFGRSQILSTIIQRKPTNYMIVGGRQIGKTSLLKSIERRYQKHHNIQCHLLTISRETNIVSALIKKLNLSLPSSETSIYDTINYFCNQNKEIHPIFMFDESDIYIKEQVNKNYEDLHQFRNLSEEGKCHFIFAGFWTLYKAVCDYHSPIRNFGEIIVIEALEYEACFDLAKIPMTKMNICYESKNIIHTIIKQTGGRANLIATICNQMLTMIDTQSKMLSMRDYEKSIDNRIFREKLTSNLENMTDDEEKNRITNVIVYSSIEMESFTLEELINILEFYDFHFSLNEIKEALLRLELAYILKRKKDSYSYCVPLFVNLIQEDQELRLRYEKYRLNQ